MNKRWRANDAGVALVEFALVAPVLLFVMIGILDVGRAVNAYVTISSAAREGSHYAALHPTAAPSAIDAAVRARVAPLDTSAGKLDVTVGWYEGATFHESWPVPSSQPAVYVPVQVRVSYGWDAVTMLIGAFFSAERLTASSTVDVLR